MKKLIGFLQLCIFNLYLCASPSLQSEGRGISAPLFTLPEEMIQKAKKFLFSKQLPDGSWRSETYGLLKSGQSLTPFVLYSLSQTIRTGKDEEKPWVQQSMKFLRSHGNSDGIHGRSDPDILDYPNYATSYALHCFLKFGDKNDKPVIQKMIHYLQNQQFSEPNGFSIKDPPYGGWGFGLNTKPSLSSFVDLSHTRRVLQALAKAESLTPETTVRAKHFLNFLQKRKFEKDCNSSGISHEGTGYDGGFFSSPNIGYANKGRKEKNLKSGVVYFRSYSTATCDGILSLLALKIPTTNPSVMDATKWLTEKANWESPSGIPLEDPAPWRESMTLYNIMVQSETFSALNLAGNWRHHLIQALRDRQAEDGSFANMDGKLMKEDDPIISTSYALIALSKGFSKSNNLNGNATGHSIF